MSEAESRQEEFDRMQEAIGPMAAGALEALLDLLDEEQDYIIIFPTADKLKVISSIENDDDIKELLMPHVMSRNNPSTKN